jgi:hypothetical protein
MVNPQLWGTHAWKFIHYITIAYPECPTEDDKKTMKLFFIDILPKILPCLKCKENFKKHLQENILTEDILNSREKLIHWGISIHNIINKSLDKPQMSIEDVLKDLSPDDKKYNAKYDYFGISILLCVILLMIICIILIIKMKN